MAEQQPSGQKKGKGCLIALAIVGVLFVVFAIGAYFLFMKAKGFVEQYADAFGLSPQMVEQVQELNEQYPFTPPEDGTISENQVLQYIAIKKEFIDRITRHEQEFKELEQLADQPNADVREYFETYSQALKILGDIRRDFLSSLENYEMSPEEYLYLTEKIYASSLGYAAEISEGGPGEPGQALPAGMQQNVQLLEKYKEELRELNTYWFDSWALAFSNLEVR